MKYIPAPTLQPDKKNDSVWYADGIEAANMLVKEEQKRILQSATNLKELIAHQDFVNLSSFDQHTLIRAFIANTSPYLDELVNQFKDDFFTITFPDYFYSLTSTRIYCSQ